MIQDLLFWIYQDVWTDADIVSEMHDEYIKELEWYCESLFSEVKALKVTYFLLDKNYIEECDVWDTYHYALDFFTKAKE